MQDELSKQFGLEKFLVCVKIGNLHRLMDIKFLLPYRHLSLLTSKSHGFSGWDTCKWQSSESPYLCHVRALHLRWCACMDWVDCALCYGSDFPPKHRSYKTVHGCRRNNSLDDRIQPNHDLKFRFEINRQFIRLYICNILDSQRLIHISSRVHDKHDWHSTMLQYVLAGQLQYYNTIAFVDNHPIWIGALLLSCHTRSAHATQPHCSFRPFPIFHLCGFRLAIEPMANDT